MPIMDGKEAIKRIRSANQPWSEIPVIALTADAMTGDREKFIALGMTDYVSKPIDQRELLAKMQQVLGLAAPRAAAMTAKRPTAITRRAAGAASDKRSRLASSKTRVDSVLKLKGRKSSVAGSSFTQSTKTTSSAVSTEPRISGR